MWFHASAMLRLFPLLPILLQLPVQVRARFCEGGHICSLPRECCTQGCCPPYQGGPRQLPPPSEHVLNLFFISHWFFWCVVVAVILAILCAYSLWKKRRTLCGWGFTEHHTQSEGDSAGSCYAPPQYSRCNSFHHPPPPYTEVTSKPDLYPLVFTCNSDNSKGNAGGSSYLMVQYFRNYIVRPAGSLSAASTVDSLSSSFICNINEANTLVPPPYSRAASPELSLHYAGPAHHREQTCAVGAGAGAPVSQSQMVAPQYGLPRSASQLVEPDYQPRQMHYATVALGRNMGVGAGTAHYSTRLHASHSGHFSPDESGNESAGGGGGGGGRGGFLQSQSDQHFRYMGNNSSSSLSDIFVNNSCAAGFVGTVDATTAAAVAATQATSLCSLAMAGGSGGGGSGTSMMYGSGGCIQSNPLHSLENCCQLVASTAEVAAASASAGSAGAAGAGATASTVSGVSSLSNIGTPSSPPQATSPTGEVREILDQISQLQADVNYEQLLLNSSKPRLQHTLSTPMARPATLQHQQQQQSASASASASASSAVCSTAIGKKYYASKPPNKALYIPMAVMTPPTAQRCVLKSPISSVVSGANFFVNRGRVARKGWITRSAPTTPGSGLPPKSLGDDSPLLLNEHDEDAIDGHGGQLE